MLEAEHQRNVLDGGLVVGWLVLLAFTVLPPLPANLSPTSSENTTWSAPASYTCGVGLVDVVNDNQVVLLTVQSSVTCTPSAVQTTRKSVPFTVIHLACSHACVERSTFHYFVHCLLFVGAAPMALVTCSTKADPLILISLCSASTLPSTAPSLNTCTVSLCTYDCSTVTKRFVIVKKGNTVSVCGCVWLCLVQGREAASYHFVAAGGEVVEQQGRCLRHSHCVHTRP